MKKWIHVFPDESGAKWSTFPKDIGAKWNARIWTLVADKQGLMSVQGSNYRAPSLAWYKARITGQPMNIKFANNAFLVQFADHFTEAKYKDLLANYCLQVGIHRYQLGLFLANTRPILEHPQRIELTNSSGECPSGVIVKALDCGIAVREFELQSHYYVHFRKNTLGKCVIPLIIPSVG